jgi:ABC-type nitrate/sulfonate/bicarbonate transport system permease component
MKDFVSQRFLLGFASLAAMVLAYTAISNAHLFPTDVVPPTQDIGIAFAELVVGTRPPPVTEENLHAAHHHHSSDHVGALLQEGVTLQESLAITAGRVLFGLAVGIPLGILLGVLMGWSRRADDYLHPIYVLLRSVPPLALITYIMLWLGHHEAHRLIPIVYAVAATMVIPAYHGTRDVAGTYLVAARSLGARPWLLIRKVLLPAASPAVLGGLRYAVALAWMTAVGAEMLMSENGMGNLIVGGGLWISRMQTKADPAVVMVGILTLAAAGWAMDALARAVTTRLTRWVT